MGTYLLVGCIPVPGNFQPASGPRPESMISKSEAGKPIHLGKSTLGDIEKILRQADFKSPDGNFAAYRYHVGTVAWVWPLCFQADQNSEARFLLLRFNENGVLDSYKVYRDLQRLRRDTVWTIEPTVHPYFSKRVPPRGFPATRSTSPGAKARAAS